MRTLRHLVILSLVVLVAVFLAAPSAMAKKKLSEDDMELITAAGQPKIVQAGSGSILFTDTSTFLLDLAPTSQTALQALTVNNVAGELQLANALNIQSAVQDITGSQTNTITQSWGATKDWTASTTAATGGVASVVVNVASVNQTSSCGKCGLNKGNSYTGPVITNNVTANGQPATNKILTKYADDIIESETGNVTVDQNPVFTLMLETGSQTTLSALAVNNVVGISQLANAINIASAGVVFVPLAIGPSSANGRNTQANTINQFRGTPYNRPPSP